MRIPNPPVPCQVLRWRSAFSDARTLLDLGCGPGTYALAILERNPQMRATLLDLAGPIAEARRRETEADSGPGSAHDAGNQRRLREVARRPVLHMGGQAAGAATPLKDLGG